MGSNAAQNTRQVWLSAHVHHMAKKVAERDSRSLRKAIEVAVATGFGYENLQELENAAEDSMAEDREAALQKKADKVKK